MTSKTALVFGWNGQDGSLITKSLLKKKFKVIGLSRKQLTSKSNQIAQDIEKEIKIEVGDIANFEFVEKSIQKNMPDEIYNLAAQSSVGMSFSYPIKTFEIIANGTLNILEAARKLNYCGRIFFAGSSEIFGETEKAATIEHNQKPISPYANAKLASFNLVKLYRDLYKINCVTGILFNHESPLRDNRFVTHKIVSEAIQCSIDKSRKVEMGNLKISRDWGWAEEYVEAMQSITRAKKMKDQIICTGKLTKIESFIEKTFQKLNLNWRDHIVSSNRLFRERDIIKSFGNPNALKKDLNWKAHIFLDEIIEKLIEAKIRIN